MSSENTFFDPFEDYLQHEGVLRRSGRYPWGSGKDPYQRNKSFLGYVEELRKKGLSDAQIAEGLKIYQNEGEREFTSTDIRALRSMARRANREADRTRAEKLAGTGMSNVAIGKEMGINESTVRSLLDQGRKERNDVLQNTADLMKERIGTNNIIDVGAGTEAHLGIAASMKNTAIAQLEEEGYKRFYVPQEQLGTGKTTNIMVIAPPGTTFPDVMARKGEIQNLQAYTEDGGKSFKKVVPPKSLSPDRLQVNWGDEGGASKDGVIELRRGVDDLSLGEARYAQVRIKVGKDMYLKGMAMYADDLPAGVDVRFNTNKAKTNDKGEIRDAMDALKPIKIDKATGKQDEDLPFGSIVRQKTYTDKNGKEQLSPLNIVSDNEEGRWSQWSKNLSSQMLSKQPNSLAKQQLGLTYDSKKAELDEIMALSNPSVKKKLLEEFADGADSSAKHLAAVGLPRTMNHVILPINSLKDHEIYAPNYKNGETVVLIRHPHGGKFEIPELKVNNRNVEANRVIKGALDAVGINAKVAERLSGADFDGDTVLVIPNNNRLVKSQGALKELKDFDPKIQYPKYDGMPIMKNKGRHMGDISNLITDMTIKGATDSEIARAVKHSMVVIDAEKHELNYKQSAIDNGIAQLKTKYQGGPRKGADTLISKAKSPQLVDERKPRSAAKGGPVDKETGEKVFEKTGSSYTVEKFNKRLGTIETKVIPRTTKSTKMDEARDAHSLSSGTTMEGVYADHANRLKSLANQARKEAVNTKPRPINPSAKQTYKNEVDSLKSKLRVAKMNAPLERRAQLLAATVVSAKRQAQPNMDADEVKKIKSLALTEMRARVGAKKTQVEFTPREWEAVQAGAVASSVLNQILNNADMHKVRQLATPRERPVMTDAAIRRAKSMAALGYTQAEMAEALGIPASTIRDAIG